MLRKESGCEEYEFIEGVPSELNRKIREGEIDVGPSSSIEYLRNREKYCLIEDHSVSSKGPVGSILLFSRMPVESLDGLTVLTSSQSETSVALLRIILTKFYGVDCPLKSTSEPLERAIKSHAACMLIGDEALIEALKWPELHIYDIGDLWYRHTGLPFTFALWLARKDCCLEKSTIFERFRNDLDRAKVSALKNLNTIASVSPLRDLISEEKLVSYWEGISYDFGDEQKKGFELFRQYSEELGLI